MINRILSILLIFLLPLIFITKVYSSDRAILLLPVAVYGDKPEPYLRQGFKSMFISRLSGEGLEVRDDQGIAGLLSEQEKNGVITKNRAEELARTVNVGYAVFGSLTTIAGGYSLDLSLIELLEKGSKLTRVSEAVDEDQFIPILSDVAYRFKGIIEGRQIASTSRERSVQKKDTSKNLFERMDTGDSQDSEEAGDGLLFKPARQYSGARSEGKLPLNISVMSFDMSDVDGDGISELLVLGRSGLFIYKREGESFALKGKVDNKIGEDFIKVSTGDMDNNGKAEIYLVSNYGFRARTSVFEWTGAFKRLDQMSGHLRVIRNSDGGMDFLLYQDSKIDEFFSGHLYLMSYEGGKFARNKEPLPNLRGVRFYSLAAIDMNGDGEPQWLGLGSESNLFVWDSEGKVLWSGSEDLGGSNNFVRVGTPTEGDNTAPRIAFEGRILVTDINGDGKKEVLTIKNIPFITNLLDFKIYTKAKLIAYDVDGTDLYPAWVSGEINFCITDMQVDGQDLYLAAQKEKLMNIGEGSGRIMWFGLQ